MKMRVMELECLLVSMNGDRKVFETLPRMNIKEQEGARAGAGAGAGAQSMALGENQERMKELEAYQVSQLNYVRILLLGDAGEAVIARFFTKILRRVRMTGKEDPGKLQLQNILSPMILSSTQWGVEDLLIAVMSF